MLKLAAMQYGNRHTQQVILYEPLAARPSRILKILLSLETVFLGDGAARLAVTQSSTSVSKKRAAGVAMGRRAWQTSVANLCLQWTDCRSIGSGGFTSMAMVTAGRWPLGSTCKKFFHFRHFLPSKNASAIALCLRRKAAPLPPGDSLSCARGDWGGKERSGRIGRSLVGRPWKVTRRLFCAAGYVRGTIAIGRSCPNRTAGRRSLVSFSRGKEP